MTRRWLLFALLYCSMGHAAKAAPIQKSTLLVVYACGAGKLALYWNRVDGAKTYYIYRRTKSTRYNFRTPTAKLANVPDSFRGSSMKLWVDRRLVNGRKYFYVIKAVDTRGRVSEASNEFSEVVDPFAIPWDSCDAKKIVDGAYRLGTDPYTKKPMEASEGMTAIGPDDMIYERHNGKYSKRKNNFDGVVPTA